MTYCFECDDFPCGLLAPTEKGADYPHNMKVYNLCRMKSNGIEAWIEESALIRKRYYEGDFVVGQGPILGEKILVCGPHPFRIPPFHADLRIVS